MVKMLPPPPPEDETEEEEGGKMRTRGKRKNGELKTRVKKRYIDKDR